MVFNSHRSLAPACVLAGALAGACQVPYGPDRHDLDRDRIFAVTRETASPPGPSDPGAVHLQAWFAVDGRLWADEPVEAAWYPLEDGQSADMVDPATPPFAVGPRALVPARSSRWALLTTFPSGVTWRAEIQAGPDVMHAPDLIEVGELDLSFTEPEEGALELDARNALTPRPPTFTPSRWFRLTATWSGGRPASLDRVRWMTTARGTTFLELDDITTDWATGLLTLDDGEVEAAVPGTPGPATLAALALDGDGANAVTLQDLWIGAPPRPLARAGRRAVLVPEGTAPGVWTGRLTPDDASPSGLALEDLTPSPHTDPAPDCAAGQPLHPDLLARGLCTRADLAGLRLTVEVP